MTLAGFRQHKFDRARARFFLLFTWCYNTLMHIFAMQMHLFLVIKRKNLFKCVKQKNRIPSASITLNIKQPVS